MTAVTFGETGGFDFLDHALSGRYTGKHRDDISRNAIPRQQIHESVVDLEPVVSDERMEIPESILNIVRASVERGENGYGDDNCVYSEAGWWFFDRQILTKFFDYQKKYESVTGCVHELLFATPVTDDDIRRRVATMDLIEAGVFYKEPKPILDEPEAITFSEIQVAAPTDNLSAHPVVQEVEQARAVPIKIVKRVASSQVPYRPEDIYVDAMRTVPVKESAISPDILEQYSSRSDEELFSLWSRLLGHKKRVASVPSSLTREEAIIQLHFDILPRVNEYLEKFAEGGSIPRNHPDPVVRYAVGLHKKMSAERRISKQEG